ncbi:Uptake hydrogenase small subunit precursor [Rhodovulum sp. PH10]|uniref:NADH-quinone oxidoreductase subunit B family protein n=1 Tax=Rhodovulum sp. PH10 TaxID=1187851 RepID=UPI00027C1E59|nr:Uptake hydrogenase small subunit precursor [Rhodovulum sp. PH10]EJW11477.1 Uptake hydrogenase small subunit precursor [Rhodovulum sp. PH10]
MAENFGVLWLQAGGCGGCTMAALDRDAGGFAELFSLGVELLWHPSLSEATGAEVRDLLDEIAGGRRRLDALVIEGAVLRGPNGTGLAQKLAGTGRTMLDWVKALAPRAGSVVAVGSCAAFGGVTAGAPDPAEACGLQFDKEVSGGVLGRDFRAKNGLPVVNIAGCAPHPGWIGETLAALATGLLTADMLDALGRPRFFADHLAHHGCSRNEFYEYKASAGEAGARGCLMEHLGCKATQAVGDCNQRIWNGGGACTHAGFACVACTAPGFEDGRDFLETPKVAGIPVGLPLDMPKAWFIALAALSKSATPRRVRANAAAGHVVVAPQRKPGKARP